MGKESVTRGWVEVSKLGYFSTFRITRASMTQTEWTMLFSRMQRIFRNEVSHQMPQNALLLVATMIPSVGACWRFFTYKRMRGWDKRM